MGTSWFELIRVGHEKVLFIHVFPIIWQEFRKIPAIALVVRDFSQDILHPGPRVDTGGLAGAYERIYDCRAIGGCVIAAEQVVLPAQGQRPDGILDEVVVDVDAPVVHIARQPGQQGVRVFYRASHPAVGKDLEICLLHPCLKELYRRIRCLQALFLALIRVQARLVGVGFHLVDLADEAQCLSRKPAVFVEGVDELPAHVCPAAIDCYAVVPFELVVGVITVALDGALVCTEYLAGDGLPLEHGSQLSGIFAQLPERHPLGRSEIPT